MRFLQIEWHNHERARNAWDIERAEMKAKIAKLEGDFRSAKKLNEMLEKQVKMLEEAIKRERDKSKAAQSGDEAPQTPSEEEVKEGWNGKIGVKASCKTGQCSVCMAVDANSMIASFPGVDIEKPTTESTEPNAETQRDQSKVFLQRCLEEVTYLLTPPSHPLPPQPHPQSNRSSFEPQDIPMHDAYLQQHQQQAQPRRRNPQLSHLPSVPNQQAPQRSSDELYQTSPNAPQPDTVPQHGIPGVVSDSIPVGPEDLQPGQQLPSRTIDEPIEQITHSFDAYGRSVPSTNPPQSQMLVHDTNGWDFGEENTVLDPSPPDTTATPHRHLQETDQFPNVNHLPAKSPPRAGHGSHRRKSSGSVGHISRRRSDGPHELNRIREALSFQVKFALRGHLDVVRSVIFTGGGSPSEPEVCTTGDDGTVKRWIIPVAYTGSIPNHGQVPPIHPPTDTDISSYFTHRGHDGLVACLAACPANNSPSSPSFSTGGRALGDGWIFSGGQDATIRVWERGRVDPKATLDGHSDAVWALAVLPAPASSILGGSEAQTSNPSLSATTQPTGGRDDRILLASGSADGSIKIWAVSAPPQLHSAHAAPVGGRRGSRRLSVTSGSNFPSSPQPSTASGTPFNYALVHNIDGLAASPTSIAPLGSSGESFVVAFADAQCVVFDTRTAESVVGMQSQETWDQTPSTGINSVVVASSNNGDSGDGASKGEEEEMHGATGSGKDGGVEGVVITGHEDRYVRFFDANSGKFPSCRGHFTRESC